jgi:hypothetical protein
VGGRASPWPGDRDPEPVAPERILVGDARAAVPVPAVVGRLRLSPPPPLAVASVHDDRHLRLLEVLLKIAEESRLVALERRGTPCPLPTGRLGCAVTAL